MLCEETNGARPALVSNGLRLAVDVVPNTSTHEIVPAAQLQAPVDLAEPAARGRTGNKAARGFVFTSYDVCVPEAYKWAEMGVKYAVWQTEECPSTKRRHHQGYVETHKPTRFTALKAAFPSGGSNAWFGVRKASREAARSYCMKEFTRACEVFEGLTTLVGPWEWGTWTASEAKASSLEDLTIETYKLLEEGKDRIWFAQHKGHLLERCSRVIDAYERSKGSSSLSTPRVRTRVVVMQGQGGTGKSSAVSQFSDPGSVFNKSNNSMGYYDGYDPSMHSTIVYEEVSSASLKPDTFKEMASTGPVSLQIKYGMVKFDSKIVMLLTNSSFDKIWRNVWTNDDSIAAIKRRIDVWMKFTKGVFEWKGFSIVRWRVKDVDDPGSILQEWVGIWCPADAPVTFGDCLARCREGNEDIVDERWAKTIYNWMKQTEIMLRGSLTEGKATAAMLKVLNEPIRRVRDMQIAYDLAEKRHINDLNAKLGELGLAATEMKERMGVYDDRYDLIPSAGEVVPISLSRMPVVFRDIYSSLRDESDEETCQNYTKSQDIDIEDLMSSDGDELCRKRIRTG